MGNFSERVCLTPWHAANGSWLGSGTGTDNGFLGWIVVGTVGNSSGRVCAPWHASVGTWLTGTEGGFTYTGSATDGTALIFIRQLLVFKSWFVNV